MKPYAADPLLERPPFAGPAWHAPARHTRLELVVATVGGILLSMLALLGGA